MSGPVLLILRLILILSLYAFLGFAIYTLWNDLKKRMEKPLTSPVQQIILTGAEINGGLSTYKFESESVVIGRDPLSDLHIDDSTISAQHCKLVYHHGQWWVEDLRSTNGTFLNQELVSEPFVITDGDVLRCGKVSFTISIEGDMRNKIET